MKVDKDKNCGIYCIKNLINDKIYIGQSTNIKKRWKVHTKELNCNTHCNSYLQKAWNKYGSDNFKFYVLEKCDKKELNEKEIYYIKTLFAHCNQNGYNLTFGGEGRRGYHLTDKQKENIRNGRINFKHSKETKEYISKIQTGRLLSDEWKENISRAHKEKIASGDIIPNIINLSNHIEKCKTPINCYDSDCNLVSKFDSIHNAAACLNVEATNICKVLKGKHKTCGGYTFTYTTENITKEELANRFIVEHGKNIHSSKYNYINLLDNDGSIIKTYQNAKIAADELGLDNSTIVKVCKGKLKQTKGYRFGYA